MWMHNRHLDLVFLELLHVMITWHDAGTWLLSWHSLLCYIRFGRITCHIRFGYWFICSITCSILLLPTHKCQCNFTGIWGVWHMMNIPSVIGRSWIYKRGRSKQCLGGFTFLRILTCTGLLRIVFCSHFNDLYQSPSEDFIPSPSPSLIIVSVSILKV
jgi:hypothetical protein